MAESAFFHIVYKLVFKIDIGVENMSHNGT